MKNQQFMSQDTRAKVEKVINVLNNYTRIIDIGIQHSPEIT